MLQYTIVCLMTKPPLPSFKGQISSTDGMFFDHVSSHPQAIFLPNNRPQQQSQKAVPLLRFVPREVMLSVLDMRSQLGKGTEGMDGRAQSSMVDQTHDAHVDFLQCLFSPHKASQPSISQSEQNKQSNKHNNKPPSLSLDPFV